MAASVNIITLNVGGRKYATALSTLTKYPDSMLGGMFAGNLPSSKDADGAYFIDADGDMFVYVLNFLRRNQLSLPYDFQEYNRLLMEAEFFQIQPLINYIREYKRKKQTVLLCMITHGVYSEDQKKVYIAHFQAHNSFQTNHIPTDYSVYKEFLMTQGYTLQCGPERIESTGKWLLVMLSQGFLTNPATPYERNVLGRFDT